MKLPVNRTGRWVCKQAVTVVAAVIVMLSATASADSSPKGKEEETVSGIENLCSEEPRTCDAAVDAILKGRLATVQQLLPLIDPANATHYSDRARCAAAYLLGELHAVEAVPTLSRALADEPGRKMRSRSCRFDAPVWNALVKIGRPAVPTMIENVEKSDDGTLRIKSLDVLNHVLGGKRRLLELLAKLESRADDKEIRRRIEECITWSREHYKENKEPLY